MNGCFIFLESVASLTLKRRLILTGILVLLFLVTVFVVDFFGLGTDKIFQGTWV